PRDRVRKAAGRILFGRVGNDYFAGIALTDFKAKVANRLIIRRENSNGQADAIEISIREGLAEPIAKKKRRPAFPMIHENAKISHKTARCSGRAYSPVRRVCPIAVAGEENDQVSSGCRVNYDIGPLVVDSSLLHFTLNAIKAKVVCVRFGESLDGS